jgi:hypothetical protein
MIFTSTRFISPLISSISSGVGSGAGGVNIEQRTFNIERGSKEEKKRVEECPPSCRSGPILITLCECSMQF